MQRRIARLRGGRNITVSPVSFCHVVKARLKNSSRRLPHNESLWTSHYSPSDDVLAFLLLFLPRENGADWLAGCVLVPHHSVVCTHAAAHVHTSSLPV